MGNEPNESKGGISPGILGKVLGLSKRRNTGIKPNPISDVSSLLRYSPTEQKSIIAGTVVPQTQPSHLDLSGAISYLKPAHDKSVKVIQESRAIMALTPEITQASKILVPSILNPNELQEAEINFEIRTDTIDEQKKTAIIKLLKEYFNEGLQLGVKQSDWVEEMLFTHGSRPVMILPTEHLKHLIAESKARPNVRVGLESFVQTLSDERPFSEKHGTKTIAGFESFNHLEIAAANFKDVSEVFCNSDAQPTRTYWDGDQKREPLKEKDIKQGLEGLSKHILEKLKPGDVIKISENPSIVRMGDELAAATKKDLNKGFDDFLRGRYGLFRQDPVIGIPEDVKTDPKDQFKLGHPAMIELPTESVIPVCVPGSNKDHIGYFLLVDETGRPIRSSVEANKYSLGTTQVEAAYNTFFNSASEYQIGGRYGDMTKMAGIRVFDHILDKYIQSRMNNMGMSGYTTDRSSDITTCMFYRLLEHKKTQLVFIPESLMVYYAFDYRDNGTGKSKMEDLNFVLSLRMTLMVASIMAMANEAINRTKVDLTFDPNQSNPEALMDMIRDSIVESRRMRFSTNPSDISRDILRQSIMVNPKNLPGLEGLDISHEDGSTRTQVKADKELLDSLTNMVITGLDVPYSALNQLSETEYSRSIATTNLLFSRKIIAYQRLLSTHNDKFVRTYIRYSEPLKKKIVTILKGSKDDATLKVGNDGSNIVGGTDLNALLDCIHTYLPSPNMAITKTQFETVREYISSLEEVLNTFYSPELIPSEDSQLINTMAVMKAHTKAVLVREYIGKTTAFSGLEMPDLSDLNPTEFANTFQKVFNFQKALTDTKSVLGAGDSSSGSGYGDYGGDSDSGDSLGGEDDSLGGDELGMDEDSASGEGDSDLGGDEPLGGDDLDAEPTSEPNEPLGGGDTGESEEPKKPSFSNIFINLNGKNLDDV